MPNICLYAILRLMPELHGTYATLIGDVVGSRQADSPERMFGRLEEGFRWVNRRISAVQELRSTVGDEFQATYADLPSALEAALLLRLYLKPSPDIRVGIGWGEVRETAPEREPMVAQTGRGWWEARTSLEEVAKLLGSQHWPRSLRTRLRGVDGPMGPALNALLIFQDQILDEMDERDAKITLGLLFGEKQAVLADELGISQPEVSRRQLANGPAALLRGFQAIRGLDL